MVNKDVAKVRVGDCIRWKADGTLGTVIEKGYNGFKVRWADEQIGIYTRGRISDLEYLEYLGQREAL